MKSAKRSKGSQGSDWIEDILRAQMMKADLKSDHYSGSYKQIYFIIGGSLTLSLARSLTCYLIPLTEILVTSLIIV